MHEDARTGSSSAARRWRLPAVYYLLTTRFRRVTSRILIGPQGLPKTYAAVLAGSSIILIARAAMASAHATPRPKPRQRREARLEQVSRRRVRHAPHRRRSYIVVSPWLGYILSVAALIAATTYFQGGDISRRSSRSWRFRGALCLLAAVRLAPPHPAPGGTMAVAAVSESIAVLGSLFTTPIVPAAFGGVAWGILGGALPGISPSITMALLLPFTYGMDPTARSCCWRRRMSARSTAARSPRF